MSRLVWYVSYGSNMCGSRFRYYLVGGRPPGASRTYPGARDHTPPRSDRAVWLSGGIYFATESQVWGGGRAFYDPDLPGKTAARAYLITTDQFSDVAAQEMYREPGIDLDLAQIATAGHIQIGPGRYETLIYVGLDNEAPMITFTAPWGADDVPLASPSAAYLRMLGQGLREAHEWDPSKAASYLANLPGARGSWKADDIASLLR
jgi:hypothetical protein